MPSFDSSTYLGRYANRQHGFEVARDNDGRLWLSDVLQGDSLEMARRAGTIANTERHELRPLKGDIFMILDDAGQNIGPVEFLGRDRHNLRTFLYFGGRAVPRIN